MPSDWSRQQILTFVFYQVVIRGGFTVVFIASVILFYTYVSTWSKISELTRLAMLEYLIIVWFIVAFAVFSRLVECVASEGSIMRKLLALLTSVLVLAVPFFFFSLILG